MNECRLKGYLIEKLLKTNQKIQGDKNLFKRKQKALIKLRYPIEHQPNCIHVLTG